MESQGSPDINKVLNSFTLFMCIPILLSLYGIYGYYTSDSELRIESLYFVGFMAWFSVIIFIPYIVSLISKWPKAAFKNVVISLIPYLMMAIMYWYALKQGAPL